MCTDCNCGNKRAIPWGAIGRRWAQPGRNRSFQAESVNVAFSVKRAGNVQERPGKRNPANVISSDSLQERNQVYKGLKPSPCSTADPELIWISVNSVLQVLGSSRDTALSLWQDDSDPSETHIQAERQWIIKNKWSVKGVHERRNQNILQFNEHYFFVYLVIIPGFTLERAYFRDIPERRSYFYQLFDRNQFAIILKLPK